MTALRGSATNEFAAAAACTQSLTGITGLVTGDMGVCSLWGPSDVNFAAPTGWTKYAGDTITIGAATFRLNTYVREMVTGDTSVAFGSNGTSTGYGVLLALGVWSGYTTLGADAHDDDYNSSTRSLVLTAHSPGGTYPTSTSVRHVFPVAVMADTTSISVDTKPDGWQNAADVEHESASLTERRLMLFSEQGAAGAQEPARTFKWVNQNAIKSAGQRISFLKAPAPPAPPLAKPERLKVYVRELPHQVSTAMLRGMKNPEDRRAVEEVLRAVSANMDHHQGTLREQARKFAALDDHVQRIYDALGATPDEEGAV